VALAAATPRPLQLIVRGGQLHLDQLYKAFNEVIFVDTTSFIKTINSQRLVWRADGKVGWQRTSTAAAYPLDSMLEHNVQGFAQVIEDIAAKSLKPEFSKFHHGRRQIRH
jgi:hypothetical protein